MSPALEAIAARIVQRVMTAPLTPPENWPDAYRALDEQRRDLNRYADLCAAGAHQRSVAP
jgi:hypothetical protein